MNSLYGLSFPSLLVIMLGYCLTVFCAQLTSMVVYAFTSGDERKRKAVKYTLYALAASAVLLAGLPRSAGGG